MPRTRNLTLAAALVALLASQQLPAQGPVGALGDLIGGPTASGEMALRSRSYEQVAVARAGRSVYSYWIQPRTRRCLVVRSTNGQFISFDFVANALCQGKPVLVAPPAEPPFAPDSEDHFETVCGVEAGGKEFRYRCRLRNEGCHGEGYCWTILTTPDSELRIDLLHDDQIEVTVAGSAPVKTTSSFRDGQTRFELGGKTHFVYRSFERAKSELAKLSN